MHAILPSEFRFRNGVRMKSRFLLAPMTNQQSQDDGVLSDAELDWLRMRAEGGFGMIVTAASQVHKNARGFPGQLGSYSDAHIPGLALLAEIGQKERALTVLQLFHGGLRSPSAINDGRRPTAPSEVTLDFPGFEVPRALSATEIEDIIADFAAAATGSGSGAFWRGDSWRQRVPLCAISEQSDQQARRCVGRFA